MNVGEALKASEVPREIMRWRSVVYEHAHTRGMECLWIHVHRTDTPDLFTYSWGSSCLRDGVYEVRPESLEDIELRGMVQKTWKGHHRHFHLCVASAEYVRPYNLELSPRAMEEVNRWHSKRIPVLFGRVWCEFARVAQEIWSS